MSPGLAQLSRIAGKLKSDFDDGGVTFNGKQVSVLINASPTLKWQDGSADKKPFLLPKGYSTVRVMKSEFESLPKIGEAFIEATVRNGNQIVTTHRVQEIQTFKLSYLCLCKVSGE